MDLEFHDSKCDQLKDRSVPMEVNVIIQEDGLHDGQKEEEEEKGVVSMAAESTFYPGVTHADKIRLAAADGNPKKLMDYLSMGPDFTPDRDGRTAIHYASLNGYGHIVALLTNAGCNIDAQDNLGYTALHRAAAQGHMDVINALLAEGCVLDKQDDVHGNAALHEAAWNGYSHTLEVLVRAKASVHLLNKQGFSALHLAAQNGHNQSARVLLYAGCDPNLKNNYGDTALHTATRYGHAGVTRILVSARCRLDATNKNGDTSLHIAAALKRRKIAKLLVEAGINTQYKNKQNESAADVARRKQHPDIVDTIMAQPKMVKEKKKQKKKAAKAEKEEKKLVVNLPDGEEKKEKKGFFFKKRNKSKDKLKEKEQQKSGSSIEVHEEHEDYKAPLRAGAAGSDASSRSSEFTSNATGPHGPHPDLMRGYSAHPSGPHHHGDPGHQARGTNTSGLKDSKAGYLSQYVPKTGVQYYKDLAGNVKQGPIGYTPVCTCGPQLKKLEQKMEADRDNLYDHIGHTHKMMTEQINKLDARCSAQVHALDAKTRERLEQERVERDAWLAQRLQQERNDRDAVYDRKHRVLRNEVQFEVNTKLTGFEKKYGHDQYCEGCDWCRGGRRGGGNRGRRRMALDDDSVNYSFHEAAAPGRLVRAHSDETLSVSSSHPSRRHWKVRTRAMKELKDKQLAQIGQRAARVESELRTTPPGAPQPVYQEIPARTGQFPPATPTRPPGRSPEGQADLQYKENIYGTWGGVGGRKNGVVDGKADAIAKLQVHDGPTTKPNQVVHQTPLVSVGVVATEGNISPPSYMSFRPAGGLNTSTPKSAGDASSSSIDLDSFHKYGSPQKPGPTTVQGGVTARVTMAEMNASQGYHRAIMAEWYGNQGNQGKPDDRRARPPQPPPLGYGQQTRGHSVYTTKQQPQPQVPTTTNNNNNNTDDTYVSGQATEV